MKDIKKAIKQLQVLGLVARYDRNSGKILGGTSIEKTAWGFDLRENGFSIRNEGNWIVYVPLAQIPIELPVATLSEAVETVGQLYDTESEFVNNPILVKQLLGLLSSSGFNIEYVHKEQSGYALIQGDRGDKNIDPMYPGFVIAGRGQFLVLIVPEIREKAGVLAITRDPSDIVDRLCEYYDVTI